MEKYLDNCRNGGNGVNTLFTLPPPGVNIANDENEKLIYLEYGGVNGGNGANGGILEKYLNLPKLL